MLGTGVPGDVEPAFRHIGEILERLAIDRVNCDAATLGHDAHDAIAGQRMAADREMNRHAGDQAPDGHDVLAALGALGLALRFGFRFWIAETEPEEAAAVARLLGLGIDRFDHVEPGIVARADLGLEILHRGDIEFLGGLFERLVRRVVAGFGERALQDGDAEADIFRAFALAHEAADTRPRLAGGDEIFPHRRRRLRLRGDDLDLVAVPEFGAQRHDLAVDLAADAGVADLGVDGVSEIDRGRAFGQRDRIALGREAEHLVGEHFELGVLEEIFGPGGLIEDIEQFAHPPVLAAVDLFGFELVAPMCRDAELGHFVHFAGADLDLDALAFGADHGGMDRFVSVGLGGRDVILEPAGNHRIGLMDDAERAVAVLDLVDDDAERHDVRKLFERDVLALGLHPDRIGLLFAAEHLGADFLLRQGFAELVVDAGHHVGTLFAQELEPAQDRIPGVGVELGE